MDPLSFIEKAKGINQKADKFKSKIQFPRSLLGLDFQTRFYSGIKS